MTTLVLSMALSRRVLSSMVLSTVAMVLALMLSACSKEPSLEQQVIASLERMEVDAEEGRFIDFMKHVAKDFKGQQGTLGRQDFQRFMMLQINENRRVYANFFPITVTGIPATQGAQQATAKFRLLVTGGQGFLPERGQLFDVSTNWVKQDGRWLLASADWDAAKVAD